MSILESRTDAVICKWKAVSGQLWDAFTMSDQPLINAQVISQILMTLSPAMRNIHAGCWITKYGHEDLVLYIPFVSASNFHMHRY